MHVENYLDADYNKDERKTVQVKPYFESYLLFRIKSRQDMITKY